VLEGDDDGSEKNRGPGFCAERRGVDRMHARQRGEVAHKSKPGRTGKENGLSPQGIVRTLTKAGLHIKKYRLSPIIGTEWEKERGKE